MPFRCEDMPESVDRIDSRTAVSDIISHQNGNYIFLILFFIILYHLLDFKIISDRFCIFFFFFFFFLRKFFLSLSLPLCLKDSLSSVRMQSESPIGVIYARLDKIIITSFSFVLGLCSVYRTPDQDGIREVSSRSLRYLCLTAL